MSDHADALRASTDAARRREVRSMLRTAHRDLERASAARRRLPPGSSRPRVTTANARWTSASEEWARVCDLAHEHGFGELVAEVAGS